MPTDGVVAQTITDSDGALLTAVLSQDADRVRHAWRAWRDAIDLDALPGEQYPLLPALYANLTRFGLTAEADPRLKGVYRRTWYSNQRLVELAATAIAILDQAEIPAVISGAAAVQDLYAGPGERPIEAIELLVVPAEVPRAAEKLSRDGWRSARKPELLATPEYQCWVNQALFRRATPMAHRNDDNPSTCDKDIESAATGQRSGTRTASDVLVLNWRLLPATPAIRDSARFAALALVAHATPARLRREAQLILAAARAGEGGPGRLAALADACMILRASTPLDRDLILDLAALLAAARPLAATMTQLASLADPPAGAHLLARLVRLGQDELPYQRQEDTRGLAGRVRFHLGRWRRIARGQGAAHTPLSLLRYLQAAAGVDRLYQLPARFIEPRQGK